MRGQFISLPVEREFNPSGEWPWYRLLSLREAMNLPHGWKEPGLGHIYFAVLSSGAIKIGATKRPKQRAQQHMQAIRIFTDLEIDAFYFTAPHTNYLQNETAIHRGFDRPIGVKGGLREVYKSLSINQAIDLISECEFKNVQYELPEDALERELAAAEVTP